MRKAGLFARWAVEYEYDYDTNCELYGCDSICRCGRYSNLRAVKVDLSGLVNVTQEKVDKRGHRRKNQAETTELERYCIDRLLRIYKAYDPTRYALSVSGGYYGEEVSDITFNDAERLLGSINEMLNASSDLGRIRLTLQAEYSFILEALDEINEVHIQELELAWLTGNDEYMRVKRGTQYEFTPDLPVGLVAVRPDGGYRLIDGYHRHAALLGAQVKEARYVVLS